MIDTGRTAFFVQNNHVQFNTIPVAQYAWRKNIDVIDRSSFAEFDPMNCGVDWSDYSTIIPWGSVQFVRNLRKTPLAKHVFYSEEAFDTQMWMTQFGERAFNFRGSRMKVSEVLWQIAHYGKLHIRPNNVDKAFVAAVFTVESWVAVTSERTISPDLECFVSPIREITAEYRCWIIGGQIIQMSQYLRDGELNLEAIESTSNTWKLAQELAEIYLPEPVVVMDVVESDGDLLFLEFNAIHSSGWYASDKEVILDTFVNWLIGRHMESTGSYFP